MSRPSGRTHSPMTCSSNWSSRSCGTYGARSIAQSFRVVAVMAMRLAPLKTTSGQPLPALLASAILAGIWRMSTTSVVTRSAWSGCAACQASMAGRRVSSSQTTTGALSSPVSSAAAMTAWLDAAIDAIASDAVSSFLTSRLPSGSVEPAGIGAD